MREKVHTIPLPPNEFIKGAATPAPNPKDTDFATVLATASGSGMLGGSILGLGGALVGTIVGAGFGYWAQFVSKQSKAKVKDTQTKELVNGF